MKRLDTTLAETGPDASDGSNVGSSPQLSLSVPGLEGGRGVCVGDTFVGAFVGGTFVGGVFVGGTGVGVCVGGTGVGDFTMTFVGTGVEVACGVAFLPHPDKIMDSTSTAIRTTAQRCRFTIFFLLLPA